MYLGGCSSDDILEILFLSVLSLLSVLRRNLLILQHTDVSNEVSAAWLSEDSIVSSVDSLLSLGYLHYPYLDSPED